MFVIARNPIDVIPSLALLRNTFSHSLEINQQLHIDQPEYWDQFVNQQINNLKLNHEIVLSAIAEKIPTYFMRYEDLRMNPRPVLEELFCFLLDVPTIKGTVVERRI